MTATIRQLSDGQVADHLFAILNDYAPTGKEQRMIVEAYWAYEKDHPGSGPRALAGMLYDGLAYGNWPWVARAGVDPVAV